MDRLITSIMIFVPAMNRRRTRCEAKCLASYGRQATIEVDDTVVCVLVLCEEQRRGGNLFGIAQPPERYARGQRRMVQAYMYTSQRSINPRINHYRAENLRQPKSLYCIVL